MISLIQPHSPLFNPNFSEISATASMPPINSATTTDTAVMVKLYHNLRIGLTNAQP